GRTIDKVLAVREPQVARKAKLVAATTVVVASCPQGKGARVSLGGVHVLRLTDLAHQERVAGAVADIAHADRPGGIVVVVMQQHAGLVFPLPASASQVAAVLGSHVADVVRGAIPVVVLLADRV